jgi:4-amino-4-deoxy-L-arabinose transferase-like glycosyltransferase
MLNKIKPYHFFTPFACLILLGATWNYDLGVTSDSVTYLEVSRSIKQLNGLKNAEGKTILHWPPVYPAVLALASALTGLDSLRAGKCLHVALIGLLFILFNIILMKVSQVKATWWIANLLLLFSIPLTVFLILWSEGLFMALLLVFILFFVRWIESEKRSLLILSAFIAGILLITRYAAIGLLGGIFIYLLFFYRTNIKEKLLSFLIFMAVLILTVLPWIIYTEVAGNGESIRSFVFHLFSLRDLEDMINTFKSWLLPESFGFGSFILPILLIITVIFLIFIPVKYADIKKQLFFNLLLNKSFMIIMLSMSLSYLFFLLLAITFFDAQTMLDNRMLSPLYLTGLLLIIPLLNWLFSDRRILIAGFIFLFIVISGMSVHSYQVWHDHYLHGRGYTSKYWKDSETLKKLVDLKEYAFYSNGVDVIKLYFPEKAMTVKRLPTWRNPHTLKKNELYEFKKLEMKQLISDGSHILVYFEKITWRDYLIGKEELLDLFKGYRTDRLKDGFIIRSVK